MEDYFDGSLDEFRFYDRPLYASEVSSLHSFESTDRYTEGLVAHHRFDGDYSDSTFYGNSVTETGALSWAEDRHDRATRALDLDGGYAALGNPEIIKNLSQAITVAGWVKLDAHTNQWQLIATKWKDNAHSWHLAINTNNKLDATYSTNGTDVSSIMETETFPVGEWQHVAMSIDVAKNSVKLFRNGFLVSSGSFGGTTIPVTESPVHYGARGEGSYKFKGGIDDFGFMNAP